ncbi:39S ribosomal protein L36, mitochondrial [Triplophysa tibetana]|uniref:Ribosomal protein n=1 Tax=Triplophysa tibetana TaxID=1572043 RepID=A0A5A9NP51_9TELE|nr:39S ribosomal protein L36, mitochondrial [Triplophysa tibetana]
MAPQFLSCLFGSLTRHLSQVARYTVLGSLPAVGAQRCIYTITSATTRFGAAINPTCKLHAPFLSPLLGQCQQLMCVQPSVGMKTKTALKRRCKDCFFVRRRGRLFVFCKAHPRHKQRQG